MAISVVMPALELTQETGKVVAWRKKEGERVAKGETLLEVETDKAVVEIEAAAEGVLGGITAFDGDVIPVGKTIAWILNPGERPPANIPSSDAASPTMTAERPEQKVAHAVEPSTTQGARISPKARRLAREHNIEIGRVRGSGADGEILASDVEALVQSPGKSAPSPTQPWRETPSAVARLMAERTTQSWTTVPHFFLVRDVDAGALIKAREKPGAVVEGGAGARPTFTDFLVAVSARVLVRHPQMNASWMDGAPRPNFEVNIGIAIAVNDGVVAGVIHNADKAGVEEIAAQSRELVERARAGRLQPRDIAGATFTISNLGMYQVDAFSAIVVRPQVAILAVGSIADRVVPIGGVPAVRQIMTLTLSCDHRAVDGARAAAFLDALADAIREFPKCLA
jgi:pyruvate dehydrogenase E2 component (dihydrolipoamide acetyltransferase)